VTAVMTVEDPATGEIVGTAPDCSPDDLDRAVAAAARAYPSWAGRSDEDRRRDLRACGAAILARADELARLLTQEQGKPLDQARAEVNLAGAWFDHTADLTVAAEELVATGDRRVRLERVPHGVVAAIAPSNFPIILAVTKVAPALLAGNTVVLKPSPLTPLTTLLAGEILGEVLPSGVLNVVSGAGALGPALVGHAGVGLVSFTGSVPTGREIARRAAGDFKRVVLELGGNDACIVLPGADLPEVAGRVLAAAMVNSGQFCAAVKRVYVPQADLRDFAALLAERAGALVVGAGSAPGTDLGPLVSAAAVDRVADFTAEAARAGGRVETGGRRLDRPGHFYEPTVVSGLSASTRLEMQEQFGPALPVMGYETLAEAIDRANATEFGLGGSVWGPADLAGEVAGALDCGTVWINDHGDLRPDAPFGGIRSSGVGVEYGYWGLLEYTRIKVRNERITAPGRPPSSSM
jgi:acyl-CoA reductase-like NAD-dependent aldehyde dehydrogenase